MSSDNTDMEDVFGQGEMNEKVDPQLLLGAIGLDEEEIAWRKDFIDFDAEDRRRLRDMEHLFRRNQDQIADKFYENLIEYDETLRVFNRSPKKIKELKETQRAYLVTLATGDYDREYFENRIRIGKLHYMLDMPMKQYMGQYGVYYDLVLSLLDDEVQDQVVDAIEEWAEEEVEGRDSGGGSGLLGGGLLGRGNTGGGGDSVVTDSLENTVRNAIHDSMQDILAVLKAINLDMQVATDAYIYSYRQQLQQEIDRQERLVEELNRKTEGDVDVADTEAGISDDISDILSDTDR